MTDWTPDLGDAKGPRYKAIANAILAAIEARELHPGQRLPTQRDLANRLGISVQTVSRGYTEAERLNYISGKVGRGTFVLNGTSQIAAASAGAGLSPDRFDFSSLAPMVSDMHFGAIKRALNELLAWTDEPALAADGQAADIDYQTDAAVRWFARSGLRASPDNLAIASDGRHALWAALDVLTAPGDGVATEWLVDSDVISASSLLKRRLHGLPVDSEGIVPEAFERACAGERVTVLCTTPTYSNPTVSLMGQDRREAIVEIARRHDVAIIEIDTLGLLAADRPAPIQSLAPDRTWYVASFCHAIMPVMRTGYLIGPRDAKVRLRSRLRATGGMSEAWAGTIAAKWMYDGTASKLIDWQRGMLRSRHAIFDDIMADHTYTAYPESMHVWLELPEQWRSSRFVRHATARGLIVTPPDPFIVGRAPEPHAVRLALGHPKCDDSEFRHGVERLAALLDDEPEPAAWDQ